MNLKSGLVEKSTQQKIFENVARKSPQIIRAFHLLYYLLTIFLIVGVYSIASGNNFENTFYKIGVYFGRSALTLLAIVILPGILGRFGIEIKLTRIINLFRRQLGILVFILAFTHYNFVRNIQRLTGTIPFQFPLPVFETLGFLALFILFWMFLTSNNTSVRKLGKWWKKLHRLVYIALWLLVLHTGLQRISIWSIFIFVFATAEVASWIYHILRKSKPKSSTNLPSQNPNKL